MRGSPKGMGSFTEMLAKDTWEVMFVLKKGMLQETQYGQ